MHKNILAVTVMTLALGGMACDKKETAQNDNRSAGEKTRDTMVAGTNKVADATGKAVDKVGDAGKAVGDKVAAATQPSADAAINKSRDTLATVIEAAVTKNHFDNLVENFAKPDRDRIGTSSKNNYDDLNQLVDQFRNDWKAKYGQDFKLSDKEQIVFGDPMKIQVGNLPDAQTAAGHSNSTSANAASVNNNMTTVIVPGGNGMKELILHLVNEGTVMNSWKIDVPDTFDSAKLHGSLMKHLKMVQADKANWPADPNKAYQIVAGHVLEALTDTSASAD